MDKLRASRRPALLIAAAVALGFGAQQAYADGWQPGEPFSQDPHSRKHGRDLQRPVRGDRNTGCRTIRVQASPHVVDQAPAAVLIQCSFFEKLGKYSHPDLRCKRP